MLTGTIGQQYGQNGDFLNEEDINPSRTYGLQLARVWGVFGAEFVADWNTSFKVPNAFLTEHPEVNAYMFNVIAKLPFGLHQAFQPYFSGGIGSIQMHTSLLAFDTATRSTFNQKSTQSEFGYDLGAGTAAFAGHWGFRFDVRWYKASSSLDTTDQLTINNINPIGSRLTTIGDGTATGNGTAANNLTKAFVSGLDFWRANIGLAFRW